MKNSLSTKKHLSPPSHKVCVRSLTFRPNSRANSKRC